MWLSSGNTEHDLLGAEESTIFIPNYKIYDHIDNETDKTEHAFGDVYFTSANNLSNSRTLCGLIKERMSFGVDSTVYVWGNTSKGRLGPYPSHQPNVVKNRVLSGMRVIDVACSKNFSLILLAHGDVYVVGNNDKHDEAYGKPNLVQELFSVRIVQIGCFGQNGCIALSYVSLLLLIITVIQEIYTIGV
jgi:alpha-tubulin suppressor-like RCC1 family protein